MTLMVQSHHLPGRNVPAGYYEGHDKVIMLVDNIVDEG